MIKDMAAKDLRNAFTFRGVQNRNTVMPEDVLIAIAEPEYPPMPHGDPLGYKAYRRPSTGEEFYVTVLDDMDLSPLD